MYKKRGLCVKRKQKKKYEKNIYFLKFGVNSSVFHEVSVSHFNAMYCLRD